MSGSNSIKHNLLLGIVVAVFAISAGVSLLKINRASEAISEQYPLTVWLIDQMEREYLQLMHTFDRYAFGEVDKDELLQDFDILWNRTDILLYGAEGGVAREVFDADKLALDLKETLMELDGQMLALPEKGNVALIAEPKAKLLEYRPIMHELHSRSFHERETVYGLSNLSSTLSAAAVAFVGLFLSGVLLILMLVAQFRASRHQAHHDELTGLANRRYFMEQLELMLQRAQRYDEHLAVFLIDLDDFKRVNDLHGHLAGDQILKMIGTRLHVSLRSVDIAARLGGDEFALIQYPVESQDEIDSLRTRLSENLRQPLTYAGQSLSVGFSIGVAVYPRDGGDVQRLLHMADMNMYREKAEHKHQARLAQEVLSANAIN